MKIRLPIELNWSSQFQTQLNATIEQSFDRINEYALVPNGGGQGQILVKLSKRDFDLGWIDQSSGGDPAISPLTTRVSNLETNLNNTNSDLNTEKSARIAGDGLINNTLGTHSSQISTLQGTVGSNSSSISSLQSQITTEVNARTSTVAALRPGSLQGITISTAAASGGGNQGDIWFKV